MMEWVSAKELLHVMAAASSPPSNDSARLRICRRAHAGLLRAHAQLIMVGDRRFPDREVPKSFWWAEGEAALEQDWNLGDFSTWINDVEVKAFRVEFLRQDAESMGVEFPPTPMIAFSAFDPEERRAAERWHHEQWWPWIDAVVWVASRQPDEIKVLAAYRALHRRSPGEPLINEVARFQVGKSLVSRKAFEQAELELLDALRRGAIEARGSATPEGALERIDPSDWSRLGRANHLQTVPLEGDPRAIVFHNLRLSVAGVMAAWPAMNRDVPVVDQPPVPAKPDEAKCEGLAASFDDAGIAIRDIKAAMIAARWNAEDGPVPKKEDITRRMRGQPRGRRAEG